MEKLETLLTRMLWKELGGTLWEDYPLTRRPRSNAPATVGLIDKGGEPEIGKYFPRTLSGKDIAVVLARPNNPGLFTAGEALAAVKLLDNQYEPKTIEGYIVSVQEDNVLSDLLLGEYPFLKLKVYPMDGLSLAS